MALELWYRINEGIGINEHLREGGIESIEVIVRGVTLFLKGVKINFELRSNGNSWNLTLPESERYDVTSRCTLHVPENPLRLRDSPNEKRVFLKFYAPREVKFSDRKMYLP